MAKQVNLSLT